MTWGRAQGSGPGQGVLAVSPPGRSWTSSSQHPSSSSSIRSLGPQGHPATKALNVWLYGSCTAGEFQVLFCPASSTSPRCLQVSFLLLMKNRSLRPIHETHPSKAPAQLRRWCRRQSPGPPVTWTEPGAGRGPAAAPARSRDAAASTVFPIQAQPTRGHPSSPSNFKKKRTA